MMASGLCAEDPQATHTYMMFISLVTVCFGSVTALRGRQPSARNGQLNARLKKLVAANRDPGSLSCLYCDEHFDAVVDFLECMAKRLMFLTGHRVFKIPHDHLT